MHVKVDSARGSHDTTLQATIIYYATYAIAYNNYPFFALEKGIFS